MFFKLGLNGKTVRELRKNRGLTARELAFRLKLDTVDILKIDDLPLKDVPGPLRTNNPNFKRGGYR
ncbi:MAG: helix-turn-helix domain-containing protein [Desulfocucumaceae bacterium]